MGFFDEIAQMKIEADLHAATMQFDAVIANFNQLTKDVNELFDMLEEVQEQEEVVFFTDFHVLEAFDELHERYKRFWTAADAARDRHKQDRDLAQFNHTIENSLRQLALDYVLPAGKLCGNIPNVVAFSMIWPAVTAEIEKVEKLLEFDFDEFSEINLDPDDLLGLQDNLFNASEAMSALGYNLIEEWEPFGDYEDNGWREEFNAHLRIFQDSASQIEKSSNEARSLLRSLWEIKKQVELSKDPSGNNSADDAISRIEKLAALLEKGLITKEEFDQKKEKLLGEI